MQNKKITSLKGFLGMSYSHAGHIKIIVNNIDAAEISRKVPNETTKMPEKNNVSTKIGPKAAFC